VIIITHEFNSVNAAFSICFFDPIEKITLCQPYYNSFEIERSLSDIEAGSGGKMVHDM
jgi:hypothetical protein